MKNAEWDDVEKAKTLFRLEENVMYYHPVYGKVHGKRYRSSTSGKIVIAETSFGEIVFVDPDDLSAVYKGPSTTPRKPKNRPKKGTKPERRIPIDEGTGLRVGDVVEDYSGNRCVIERIDTGRYEARYVKTKNTHWLPRRWFKCIFLPYQEPAKQEEGPVEETYTYGEWISFDNEESKGIVGLLCHTEYNKVMFTAKEAFFGNRWLSPVEVENSWHISKREILQILGEDATNIRKVNVEITVKD